MTQRPDTPEIPSDQPEGQSRRTASSRPGQRPATAPARRPRPRTEYESRRVRRSPSVGETTPWYNNWRLLVPIVGVILAGIILLGFALGQQSQRQAAAPAAQPTQPALQITAQAGNQQIPVTVVASTPASAAPAATPVTGQVVATAPVAKKYSGPPPMTIDTSKTYVATLETDKGKIVMELYPQDAPQHVNNFVFLAKDGFYNGLTFHRVEPGFVIQGGDPQGNGQGGPGYNIPAEIKRKHPEGAVAAARLGDQVNPNRESSGSQFYITLAATPNLDGAYTSYGQVVEGMDVAKKIARGDKINNVTITTK